MSYARVIVNPSAGAGRTAKKWPQIMGLLKDSGLRFDHDFTEAPACFYVLRSALQVVARVEDSLRGGVNKQSLDRKLDKSLLIGYSVSLKAEK